jgi:hypothetical protein
LVLRKSYSNTARLILGIFLIECSRDENGLYSEWVPAGKFVKTIVGFVSLLFLLVLAISTWVGFAIQNPAFVVIIVFPLALVLIMYGNYRGIQIKITSTELVIRYGFLNRKHIDMTNIVSYEPTTANFGKYWGVGVRYGFDRSLAYTTSFGNAVKIVLKEGRPFVFSSHNPQEICNIINQVKTKSRLDNSP